MTAHKHAEMIKAKADNMELVVFRKNYDNSWGEVKRSICFFAEDSDYFLCLPQHKEACLHWLGGGEIEYDNVKNWIAYDFTIDNPKYPLQDFTGLEFNFRIKPKKEKRWIIATSLACWDRLFNSKDEAVAFVAEIYPESAQKHWTYHEIEIEV